MCDYDYDNRDERFVDITICQRCDTAHLDPYSRCPKCGAGVFHQCSTTREGRSVATLEYAAKAYRTEAAILRAQAQEAIDQAEEYELEAEQAKLQRMSAVTDMADAMANKPE